MAVQPIEDRLDGVRPVDVQQQRELVAADARRDVARAQAVAQVFADLTEHRVAALVADAIVDRLEAVEVEQHEPEAPAVAHAAADRRAEVIVEAAAVVEARERIVQRLVVQAVEAERDLTQPCDGVEVVGLVDERRFGVNTGAPAEHTRRQAIELERTPTRVEELQAEHRVVEDDLRFLQIPRRDEAIEARGDERDARRGRRQLVDEVGQKRASARQARRPLQAPAPFPPPSSHRNGSVMEGFFVTARDPCSYVPYGECDFTSKNPCEQGIPDPGEPTERDPRQMGIGNINQAHQGAYSKGQTLMLDERKAAILRAVVEEYIETAQPVGSGHIAPAVNVSSATVRNDMAALEHEGYLRQPHTSAGRVPTDKGYRYFVDSLRGPGQLGTAQVQQVRSFFAKAHGELEQMLHDTSRLLSDLTEHTAVVIGRPPEATSIRSVQVVGLGGGIALVVLVMSNGAIEKRTIDLPPDAGDDRLGAATAHLTRHLMGSHASGTPGDRAVQRRSGHRRPGERGRDRVARRARRRRADVRGRSVPHGPGVRRRRNGARGARHPRAAVRRRHGAARRARSWVCRWRSEPRPVWRRWPSARSSSLRTRSKARRPARSACSARRA